MVVIGYTIDLFAKPSCTCMFINSEKKVVDFYDVVFGI